MNHARMYLIILILAAASWFSGIEVFRAIAFPTVIVVGYCDLLVTLPDSFWRRCHPVSTWLHRISELLAAYIVVGPWGIFLGLTFWGILITSLVTSNGYWLMGYLLIAGLITGPAFVLDRKDWDVEQTPQLIATTQ